MYRIDVETAVAGTPSYGAAGPVSGGMFTDGLPGVADGTIPGADWFNHVMMELCKAVVDDGASLSKADDGQLAARLSPLKGLKTHATSTGAASTTHRRAVLASYDCAASGAQSTAAASSGATVSGIYAFAAATFSACVAGGTMTGVLAAQASTVSGTRALAAACNACTAPGENAAALAAASSDAAGTNSAVLAADGCHTTSGGLQQAAVASESCTLDGTNVGTFAADDCSVTTSEAAAIASFGCDVDRTLSAALAADNCVVLAPGSRAVVAASQQCAVSGTRSMLVGSSNAELADSNTLAMGYSASGITPGGTNQNLTFKVDGATGTIYSDVASHGGGADFAEYFPNAAPAELPAGRLVTLTDSGVRLAQPGDSTAVGVVSASPALVGNAAPMGWTGRFARDEWGRVIVEPVPSVRWPAVVERRVTPGRLPYVGPASECPYPAAVVTRRWTEQVTTRRTEEVRPPGADPRAAQMVGDLVARLPARMAAPIRGAARRLQAALAAERRMRVVEEVADVEFVEVPLIDAVVSSETVREAYAGPVSAAPADPPEDAVYYEVRAPRPSPAWDPARRYVPRSERPQDYTCVALLGQVHVAVDSDLSPMAEVAVGRDGLGTATRHKGGDACTFGGGRRLRVQRMTSPFAASRGYGIALCVLA